MEDGSVAQSDGGDYSAAEQQWESVLHSLQPTVFTDSVQFNYCLFIFQLKNKYFNGRVQTVNTCISYYFEVYGNGSNKLSINLKCKQSFCTTNCILCRTYQNALLDKSITKPEAI